MRAIPYKTYLELFAKTGAEDLRDILKQHIDTALFQLGSMEFELPMHEEILDGNEHEKINGSTKESTSNDTTAEDTENE